MNKGTIRILVALGLVILLGVSWYTLISDGTKQAKQYNTYINTAREKAKLKIEKDAVNNYESALAMRDTIELRDEVAQFYKDLGEYGKYSEYCSDIIDRYPYEKNGYERLVEYYSDTMNYYQSYSTANLAEKRGVQSDKIKQICEQNKYKYEVTYVSYRQTGPFTGGYFPVQKEDGTWGFINAYGSTKVSCIYKKVAPFTSSKLAPAYTQKGRWELIDTSGNTKSVDAEEKQIEDVRAVYSDLMAVKYAGKYHYCDVDFKEKFGSYDDASAFSSGVAAVKNGSQWMIIDDKGNQVGSNTFDEILMDDKTVAFRNNVAFARKGDKYILIDTKGNQVGNSSWDEADAFNSDQPAAVRTGEKWGFVNEKGETVVEPKYDGAHSFSNGFAAVKDGKEWGFIESENYKICIDYEFDDAGDFSDGGSVFVKRIETWSLLKVYSISKQK